MRTAAQRWIRASWVLTDRAWVTTDELAKPTRAKLERLWHDRKLAGMLDRAGSLLPGPLGRSCDRRVVARQIQARRV